MLDDDDPDVRLFRGGRRPPPRGGPRCRARARAGPVQALARPERVIERLGPPWAVESLLAQLRELDARGERRAGPRVGVARALGHAGDPCAEPAMIGLLGKGSLEERISAARALGSIGGRRSRRMSSGRCSRIRPWPLRAQAAKALGTIELSNALSFPASRGRCSTILRGGCARTAADGAGSARRPPGHAALERRRWTIPRPLRARPGAGGPGAWTGSAWAG